MIEAIKIVVTVSGGCVQSIVTRLPVDVVVVDYDNIEQGDPPPDLLQFDDGANVAEFMRGCGYQFDQEG